MHLCDWSDRLEAEDGRLLRIVTATARCDRELARDVYREYEDGRYECRNLYYSMYGYRVGFPGETSSLYAGGACKFVEQDEGFCECRRIAAFPSRRPDGAERALAARLYPGFGYVLDKWTGTIEKTLAALRIWRGHPDVERVLAAGFEKVALNGSFWRLTEGRRMEVVSFMRRNPQRIKMPLSDILTVLKHKISLAELGRYKEFRRFNGRAGMVGYEAYRYLKKIGMDDRGGASLYRDYRSLLARTSHDANDGYWKYPKDLQGRHDRLREEAAKIDELDGLEKIQRRQAKYAAVARKFAKLDSDIDGYRVYVPQSVEDIMTQGKGLHQCLVEADYIGKVIRKECVLVFIRKGEEPVATAQLLRGDRIGQFYADELDRRSCLPDAETRAALDKWLAWKKSKGVAGK